MKTFLLTFTISAQNGGLSLTDVEEDLQSRYGKKNLSFYQLSEFDTAAATGLEQPVWVHIPADDSEPLCLVPEKGEEHGTPLAEAAIAALQEHGVCVELYATYPRADRYGAPGFAIDDLHAKAYVGDYGFKVAESSFVADVSDRGDDGAEQAWLRIMLPASFDMKCLERFNDWSI